MPRARSIQIYLKQGIEQDDQLLALWSVCRDRSRPQEVFRRMLARGFEAMREAGELPESIVEAVGAAMTAERPSEVPPPRQTSNPAPTAKPAPAAPAERSDPRPVKPEQVPSARPAPRPRNPESDRTSDTEEGDSGAGSSGKLGFIGDIM